MILPRTRTLARARAAFIASMTLVVVGTSSASARAETVGDRWTAMPGQAFNDGWKPLGTAATYRPCQTVRWSFDRNGEDPDRSTMIDDIRTGLAELQRRSGLTFVEVASGSPADLTFRWADLTAEGRGPNVSGYGGFNGPGVGAVAFSNRQDWTRNTWAGWDWRRIETPRPDLGPGWYSVAEGPGRVALVIHEVMHAMGFGHVEDFTSIMYPQGGIPNNRGQLSSGDIAGLRTMYLDRPCTSTPTTAAVATSDAGAQPPDVVRLKRTWGGTRVQRQSLGDGRLTAQVATRLAPGARFRVTVWDWDAQAEQWKGRATVGRIGPRGRADVDVAITRYDSVELRDAKGRMLARWTSA